MRRSAARSNNRREDVVRPSRLLFCLQSTLRMEDGMTVFRRFFW
jgi:hypothetical protein